MASNQIYRKKMKKEQSLKVLRIKMNEWGASKGEQTNKNTVNTFYTVKQHFVLSIITPLEYTILQV